MTHIKRARGLGIIFDTRWRLARDDIERDSGAIAQRLTSFAGIRSTKATPTRITPARMYKAKSVLCVASLIHPTK